MDKLKLFEYYKDDWYYRNKHYWGLVVKHIWVCLVVIIFPYVCSFFNVVLSDKISFWAFRIVGLIVSVFFVFLLLCENMRMRKSKEALNDLIKEIWGEQYIKKIKGIFGISLAHIIPFVVAVFHLFVAFAY